MLRVKDCYKKEPLSHLITGLTCRLWLCHSFYLCSRGSCRPAPGWQVSGVWQQPPWSVCPPCCCQCRRYDQTSGAAAPGSQALPRLLQGKAPDRAYSQLKQLPEATHSRFMAMLWDPFLLCQCNLAAVLPWPLQCERRLQRVWSQQHYLER